MTDAELDEVLSTTPVLYHMAEPDTWSSIRDRGLLSTSAILDLLGIDGDLRRSIEDKRRSEKVVLEKSDFGRLVIRDNKPMDDAGLRRVLLDGLTPADWYKLLNRRIFFWLTRDRLFRLLTARPYAGQEHDVLEIDARALVEAYRESIELSPINSGATKPFGTPRGKATFLPIADYPYAYWAKKRRRGERVVELTVIGGIVDIERFVRRVVRMQADRELGQLFVAPAV